MTEAEFLAVPFIPLDLLDPADDNLRTELRDLEGLAKSIEAVGILQPLLVAPRTDAEGRFRIVAGHRRHAAARLAGLDRAPAIVRADYADDAGRQVAMLVENVHRDDLSPLERARGFRQLMETTGRDQKGVAELTGMSQPTISKALALLELPEAVAAKVGGPGGIHVDDAPLIVKLKDHPKELAAVEKRTRGRRDDVASEAKQTLSEIEDKEKTEALKSEAKEKGWKIVREARGYGQQKATYQILAGASGYHYSALAVDRAKHRKEKCHGVYVPEYGAPKLVEVCTKPERHKPKGDSDLKVKSEPRRQRTAHEQRQLDEQKARKVAFARRTEHLKPILATGGGRISAKLAMAVVAKVLIGEIGSDAHKAACELLGLEVPSYKGHELGDEAAKSESDLVRVGVACALAVGHVGSKAQWHGWDASDVRALYEFLGETGYEADEFEAEKLEPEKPRRAPGRKRAARRVKAPARDEGPDPTDATGADVQTPSSIDAEDVADPSEDGDESPKSFSDDVTSEDDFVPSWPPVRIEALRLFAENGTACEADGQLTGASRAWLLERDLIAESESETEQRRYELTDAGVRAMTEQLGLSLPVSEIERKVEQRNKDLQAEPSSPGVSPDLAQRLNLVSITVKGHGYLITCNEHGQIGRAPATTLEFAEIRRDDHLWEDHGIAPPEVLSSETVVEVTVENTKNGADPWKVTCSATEHDLVGSFGDPRDAHERAQGHIDVTHEGSGVIREAEVAAAS